MTMPENSKSLENSPASDSTPNWSRPLANGRLECLLCPRHCRLKEGQRGFCYIRRREGTRIVNTGINTSLGFQIDPIEKKPLNHFYPTSTALSFGTAGCNLGCLFCQNWHLSRARAVEESSAAANPLDIAKAAKRYDCRSVAFTYNDPTIWADYAVTVARACHELDVKTVAVSNGYIDPEPRAYFYQHMDAANIDLKGFTDKFYRRSCLATLKPVLDTLIYIRQHTKTWLELTTLIIPGLNDSPREMELQADWIVNELGAEVPLHLTAFHPTFQMTDRPATPADTLFALRQVALDRGLLYVYTGNIMSPSTQSTFCPRCGELMIERHWHKVQIKGSRPDICPQCLTKIAGCF